MPHLLVDISSHGYGHVSQTAPVVNELVRRIPELRVTLRTGAPAALLAQRFECRYEHIPLELDFGMKMASAVEVRAAASHLAYQELHSDWAGRVAHEARAMRDLQPDLLLANVPYLSLAAAKHAGVRAVGMCSLNWADIYLPYCAELSGSTEIHRQMLAAYNSVDAFLRIQPAMPMADLDRARSISPIAKPGRVRRTELAECLQLCAGERCVLVAMGGMEYRLPVEDWPHHPGIRWLLPASWAVVRSDMVAFDALDLPFSDLLASCDAVLTKPGYGTFAEAACVGVPVLYASRGDWPESQFLVEWLQRYVPCHEVTNEQLRAGKIAELLESLWAAPSLPVCHPLGALDAAEHLSGYFA
ncbi:MAG: hypothetical protein HY849_04315 [Nitrosomonadales bacterium]|nr:hypothetical protein [Nitrosomonadales bacterium]